MISKHTVEVDLCLLYVEIITGRRQLWVTETSAAGSRNSNNCSMYIVAQIMAFIASPPMTMCGGGGSQNVQRRSQTSTPAKQIVVAARGAATAALAAALLASGLPNASLATGLNSAGRLEKCRGDEACISTSSVGNPSKFGAPWTFEPQTSDADTAWAALKESVRANKDKGEIVDVSDGPKAFYLRAEFPSSFGRGIEWVFPVLHTFLIVTPESRWIDCSVNLTATFPRSISRRYILQ
jgi:hypothetical protein